jgi:aryl sulfotransferase
MGRIAWIGSYPKAGSTWLRMFFANLVSRRDRPVSINDPGPSCSLIASSRALFDELTGLASSDLKEDEIEFLRPAVYGQLASRCDGTIFVKIHDAYHENEGRHMLPVNGSVGILYVVRNPLDTAVSFARHSSWNIDRTIANMANEAFALSDSRLGLAAQLRQPLRSWSGHVESWLSESDVPLRVVRYEDMKAQPVATFAQAARFLGCGDDEERIDRAIEWSGFGEMRRQEQAQGFSEKMPGPNPFFRKADVGEWRNVLTESQVRRIVDAHGPVMERLGYLDRDGTIRV